MLENSPHPYQKTEKGNTQEYPKIIDLREIEALLQRAAADLQYLNLMTAAHMVEVSMLALREESLEVLIAEGEC